MTGQTLGAENAHAGKYKHGRKCTPRRKWGAKPNGFKWIAVKKDTRRGRRGTNRTLYKPENGPAPFAVQRRGSGAAPGSVDPSQQRSRNTDDAVAFGRLAETLPEKEAASASNEDTQEQCRGHRLRDAKEFLEEERDGAARDICTEAQMAFGRRTIIGAHTVCIDA